jgi:hypothetical protein
MNKQIEEIGKLCCTICKHHSRGRCFIVGGDGWEAGHCLSAKATAERIYNAGYLKQIEGEWGFDGMSWTCSECGEYATKGLKTNFCPNCGAKMKGDKTDEQAD